jgi:Raf kinase inhibitor-like YbhB/YbcL family protein
MLTVRKNPSSRLYIATVCTIFVIAAVISITMSSSSKSSMKLTSSAFADGSLIPVKYTCNGKEISPPLEISGVPAGAKSLILTLEDPDAPIGTWDHWMLFNIDPKTMIIPEGSVPEGAVVGSNTGGTAAYEGPCPPSGMHRYVFTLYAISTKLSLPEGSSKATVLAAMNGNVLAMAELMGKYGK